MPKKKLNKNYLIGISVFSLIFIIAILFILFNSPEDFNESIEKIKSNLGEKQAEQLVIDANQDWVVDLNPNYKVEVVETFFNEGIWTVKLKIWDDRDNAPIIDKKGFVLDYKVDDLTGEVMKNPKRIDLN